MAEVFNSKHTAKEIERLLDKVKEDKSFEALQKQNDLLQEEIDKLESILNSVNRTVV